MSAGLVRMSFAWAVLVQCWCLCGLCRFYQLEHCLDADASACDDAVQLACRQSKYVAVSGQQ